LPLLGSNQDSPDPVPLRLSPPLRERSWSGLCLHLRPYAVRWLPPSLYTFPSRGLARRCQSRVRRLREHSRTSFPAWCPASAPLGVPLESGVLPVTPRGSNAAAGAPAV